MIGMGHLYDWPQIRLDDAERVPLSEREAEVAQVRPGDLLFARRSLKWSGAGVCLMAQPMPEPTVFESSLIRVRLDPDRAHAPFLSYYFRAGPGRHAIESIIEQTAVAGIRASDLARLCIAIPNLAEQRAIASVLGALDDKIESNRRLASALANVSLAAVDQACQLASDTTRLNEVCDQIRRPGNPVHPYIGLDLLPKGSTILENWNVEDGPDGASWAFEAGDVLFGKLRPYFRKVVVAPLSGRCSREILVLRPSQPDYYGLAVATIASKAFIDYCTAISTGTKMPRAEWKDASNFEVGLPSGDVLAELAQVTRRNYAWATSAIRESRTLAAIRDALLPRLVSGQMRVPLSDDPEETKVGAAAEALGS